MSFTHCSNCGVRWPDHLTGGCVGTIVANTDTAAVAAQDPVTFYLPTPTNLTERLAKEICRWIDEGIFNARELPDWLAEEIAKDFIPKQEAAEQVAAVVLLIVNELGLYQKDLEGKGEADAAIMCSIVKNVIAVKKLNPTEILAQRDEERLCMYLRVIEDVYDQMDIGCADPLDLDEIVEKWIPRDRERVRQAALEEAAKAVCEYCRVSSLHYESRPVCIDGVWVHVAIGMSGCCKCQAQAIRALMEKTDV